MNGRASGHQPPGRGCRGSDARPSIRRGPSALLLLLSLVLLDAAPAGAQRTLVIERFNATVDIGADGTIVVEETIVPRFTGSWNGIYRTIPVQYRTPQGLNYTLRLDVEAVTDGEGAPLKYESSRERHYRKLKIWVPGARDATRIVKLRYRVPNGLKFFEEHDELYWNVTGDEWEVPIESASARVRLPEGVVGVRATAFRGAYGSTQQAEVTIDPAEVHVAAIRGLGFREGLTVVVGWNPGVVHRPTAIEKTTNLVYSNLPLAIPPLVLIGMFYLWRARGRDPELAPIATQYEPPEKMSPAELGTLVDGKPDMRDLTATIVDLAVRGYVHIEEIESSSFLGLFSNKDFRFTLKKPRGEWSALRSHERDMLRAVFAGAADSVELSDLKNKFYKHLPGLRNDLYGMLVHRGYYTGRPDRVRMLYMIGGAVLGVVIAVASAGLMTALGMQPGAGVAAGILSGIIIAFFGWFMPSRTVSGTRELEKVLGFQEFLTRVESDRLDRIVKTPQMFEAFLPYAMALGVEDNWAKAFEGIYQQPPQWYSGPGGVHTFRPSTFTSSLGRMSSQAATVMASAPRSSGGSGFSGGSSGGGFGGGGGGGF
ncbi:MAG TPA: DUF2207 domain-containing protein [Vicinamibacterales bacterium]|nr:DUF2207 domain-containing protein [Vicinamibacterales bacterium]